MAKKATKSQSKSTAKESKAKKPIDPKTTRRRALNKASEKPLQCPDCKNRYKTQVGLDKHRKLHDGDGLERPGPGRPLKFGSVEEVEEKIQEYFNSCAAGWRDHTVKKKREIYDEVLKKNVIEVMNGRVEYDEIIEQKFFEATNPTVSGLAYALDTSRRTLLDYEETDEYSHTIKRAKQYIESVAEAQLVNKGGAIPAGIIFNLKNNFGWVDRQELDVTDKQAAARKALDHLEEKNKAEFGENDMAAQAAEVLKHG